MLCIIVPNRLRAIPEFFSWAGQHISIRNLWEVPPPPHPPSPIQASVTISATRKYKISHLQLHIPDNYRLGKAVNDKSQRDFRVVAVCDFYQIRSNPPSCIPWHIPLLVLVPYPWSKPITCSFSYFFASHIPLVRIRVTMLQIIKQDQKRLLALILNINVVFDRGEIT